MKLIYLIGKSSSGKDTIFKELLNLTGYNSYITYTTRPMRNGEKQGVEYYFISDKKMNEYIKEHMVIECRAYKTVYGEWKYATIDDEQFKSNNNIITIGTLESYNKIREFFLGKKDFEIIPVYIEVPDNIRLRRAIEREEKGSGNYDEMCRRFIADCKDFSDENLKNACIEKRFKNIVLDKCLNEILDYIGFKK